MENSHLGSLTTERRNERSRRIHQAEDDRYVENHQ
jgi:N-acetylmuramic acid 6-phosphate etherase